VRGGFLVIAGAPSVAGRRPASGQVVGQAVTPILPAVRSAHAAGLSLLPVRDDGSKAPAVSAWRAFQMARPTVDNMRAWFTDTPRTGFGLVAGAVSGHRECWDFDDAHVFEAFVEAATASGLGAVVARIRAGYEDRTPGGGVRWIVTYALDRHVSGRRHVCGLHTGAAARS